MPPSVAATSPSRPDRQRRDDSQIDQAAASRCNLHLTVSGGRGATYGDPACGLSRADIATRPDVRSDNSACLRPVGTHADACVFPAPGRYHLGATIERVHAPRHRRVRVDGKSSLRRFIRQSTSRRTCGSCHGQITLEMVPAKDILVAPGWPICSGQVLTRRPARCEVLHRARALRRRRDGRTDPNPSRSHLLQTARRIGRRDVAEPTSRRPMRLRGLTPQRQPAERRRVIAWLRPCRTGSRHRGRTPAQVSPAWLRVKPRGASPAAWGSSGCRVLLPASPHVRTR